VDEEGHEVLAALLLAAQLEGFDGVERDRGPQGMVPTHGEAVEEVAQAFRQALHLGFSLGLGPGTLHDADHPLGRAHDMPQGHALAV